MAPGPADRPYPAGPAVPAAVPATGSAAPGAGPDRLAALVGTADDPFTVAVERGRLRFFALATGQDDPVYVDPAAARAAGHPDLPVPPTFLFTLELDRPDPFGWLRRAGVAMGRVLHGEQSFTYHSLAHAGDTLTFRPAVTDVYERKGGALRFVVRRTDVDREGSPVATLEQVVVVRPEGIDR